MQLNKSYLKWAGGKGRILDQLLPVLDKHMKSTFVEPFAGALNVSLNVDTDHVIINDYNKDLINAHQQIVNHDYEAVIDILEGYFDVGYDAYYELRDEFNSTADMVKKAALFIYLNKFGFNGLCRYNKSGKFNVPIGKSPSKKQSPVKEIIQTREILNGRSTIISGDVNQSLFTKPNSLVYCDPPYVPVSASNFNYNADGFGFNKQKELRDFAKQSPNTVIISNHWCDITESLYSDADEVILVDAKRTISSKSGTRGKTKECIVIYRGY